MLKAGSTNTTLLLSIDLVIVLSVDCHHHPPSSGDSDGYHESWFGAVE
jgi:hypothetical protein